MPTDGRSHVITKLLSSCFKVVFSRLFERGLICCGKFEGNICLLMQCSPTSVIESLCCKQALCICLDQLLLGLMLSIDLITKTICTKNFTQKIFTEKFSPKNFHPKNFLPEKFSPKKFSPKLFHPNKFAPKNFCPKKFRPKKLDQKF